MKNLTPFTNSSTNKRYYTSDHYYKQKWNTKVFKIGLDAGFTCPNRDGKISTLGCFFCSQKLQKSNFSLIEQFNNKKKKYLNKYPNAKFIAYFQSFSNTYDNVESLKQIYEPFINEEVVAINIATRPDCINLENVKYLKEIASRKPLYVELGLQTCNDDIADNFNRGYSFDCFLKALYLLNKYNIDVIVHLIIGLKNQTIEDAINDAIIVSRLDIHGIKFHNINIVKDTIYSNMFQKEQWNLLTKEQYINTIVTILQLVPSNIVIYRLVADTEQGELIAPDWATRKIDISNGVDKYMAKLNLVQAGKVLKTSPTEFVDDLIKQLDDAKIHAIDCTGGNGYDSIKLSAKYLNVTTIDIQPLAINRINKKIVNIDNIEVHLDNFINVDKYIKKETSLIIYNLGFLPGSDHKIATNYLDTIESIKKSLSNLGKGSNIIITSYTKHPGGIKEYIHIKKILEEEKFVYSTYYFNNSIVFKVII